MTSFREAVCRYQTHVQIAIPESDDDAAYQLSPFYGDPDQPSVYPWAECILTRGGRLLALFGMEAAVFEQYGHTVELKWWPIRFVFPDKRSAMMFLLRSG